jgi:Domain of unknown function (DUF397)
MARTKMVRQESNEPRPAWTKATASGAGACVEIAVIDGKIAVRDSKHPDGGILSYPVNDWSEFLQRVKAGTYDYFVD